MWDALKDRPREIFVRYRAVRKKGLNDFNKGCRSLLISQGVNYSNVRKRVKGRGIIIGYSGNRVEAGSITDCMVDTIEGVHSGKILLKPELTKAWGEIEFFYNKFFQYFS